MRTLPFVLLAAGCTGSDSSISILPAGEIPLGVALTQRYEVTEELCDGAIFRECDPGSPSALAVTLASGTAARVATVDPVRGEFELTGISPGATTFHIEDGSGASSSFAVTTADVAATRIFVPRTRTDGYEYMPFESEVAAFTGEAILIGQASVAPDGSMLRGNAELTLSPGTTDTTFDRAAQMLYTRFATGTAQLMGPYGLLALDVVDTSAIATLQIEGATGDHQLQLVASSASTVLDLIPFDARGLPIAGAGPTPTVTAGDPSILSVQESSFPPGTANLRRVVVQTHAAGTTTLEIQWGNFDKTFDVAVTTFGP